MNTNDPYAHLKPVKRSTNPWIRVFEEYPADPTGEFPEPYPVGTLVQWHVDSNHDVSNTSTFGVVVQSFHPNQGRDVLLMDGPSENQVANCRPVDLQQFRQLKTVAHFNALVSSVLEQVEEEGLRSASAGTLAYLARLVETQELIGDWQYSKNGGVYPSTERVLGWLLDHVDPGVHRDELEQAIVGLFEDELDELTDDAMYRLSKFDEEHPDGL